MHFDAFSMFYFCMKKIGVFWFYDICVKQCIDVVIISLDFIDIFLWFSLQFISLLLCCRFLCVQLQLIDSPSFISVCSFNRKCRKFYSIGILSVILASLWIGMKYNWFMSAVTMMGVSDSEYHVLRANARWKLKNDVNESPFGKQVIWEGSNQ